MSLYLGLTQRMAQPRGANSHLSRFPSGQEWLTITKKKIILHSLDMDYNFLTEKPGIDKRIAAFYYWTDIMPHNNDNDFLYYWDDNTSQ